MSMNRFYQMAFLAVAVFVNTAALAADPVVTAKPFQAGDRWAAVGDSITHGGLYHAGIYLYYATRFPHQRFEVFNGGVSGDTAGGTLKRLQADILCHKPTVASIMLGMNDIGRGNYTTKSTGAGIEAQRKGSIDGYDRTQCPTAVHRSGIYTDWQGPRPSRSCRPSGDGLSVSQNAGRPPIWPT